MSEDLVRSGQALPRQMAPAVTPFRSPRVIRDRMAAAYKLQDRRADGYRGRWRYVVFALVREPNNGFNETLASFTNRASAAAFTAKCAAFGEAFAYRIHARQMAPTSPIHARLVAPEARTITQSSLSAEGVLDACEASGQPTEQPPKTNPGDAA